MMMTGMEKMPAKPTKCLPKTDLNFPEHIHWDKNNWKGISVGIRAIRVLKGNELKASVRTSMVKCPFEI